MRSDENKPAESTAEPTPEQQPAAKDAAEEARTARNAHRESWGDILKPEIKLVAKCAVCQHAKVSEINAMIFRNEPVRDIAREHKIARQAVAKHIEAGHAKLGFIHVANVKVFVDPDAPEPTRELVQLCAAVAKEAIDGKGGRVGTIREKISACRMLQSAVQLQARHAGKDAPQPGEDVGNDPDDAAALARLERQLKRAEKKYQGGELPN